MTSMDLCGCGHERKYHWGYAIVSPCHRKGCGCADYLPK